MCILVVTGADSHFFLAYKQPLFYNIAVAREVVKQIYVAESLQPPALGAIRTAYETLWTRAISPAYWRSVIRSGEVVRVGIYGVEAYTIFKVCGYSPSPDISCRWLGGHIYVLYNATYLSVRFEQAWLTDLFSPIRLEKSLAAGTSSVTT